MAPQAPHACWWLPELQRLEREWQVASTRAQAQLAKVADCIQKTTYLEGEHWGPLGDCGDLHERASSRLWDLAHRCQRRLFEDVEEMAEIYARMSTLLHQHDAARKLDERTRQRYEAFLVEILGMYERELVAKSLMSADVFECRQHDTMTVYIAAWQMQPHLDKERVEEITKLVINDAHYQV